MTRLKSSMQVFEADGRDVFSLQAQADAAVRQARSTKRPTVLLIDKLSRRFGHAATDRQEAYLSPEEIEIAQNYDPLISLARTCVENGAMTADELAFRFDMLSKTVENAFETAAREPGASSGGRDALVASNSASIPVPKSRGEKVIIRPLAPDEIADHAVRENKEYGKATIPDVMRKHMNRALSETLESDPRVVYLGEDVQHGIEALFPLY